MSSIFDAVLQLAFPDAGDIKLYIHTAERNTWRIKYIGQNTWQAFVEPNGYRIVYTDRPPRVSFYSETNPYVSIRKLTLRDDWVVEIRNAAQMISLKMLDNILRDALPRETLSMQFDGVRIWDFLIENPALIAEVRIENNTTMSICFYFPVEELRVVSFQNPTWRRDILETFFPFRL